MKHTFKLSAMILLVLMLVLSFGMLAACSEEPADNTTNADQAAASRGDVVKTEVGKDGLTWTLYSNGELVFTGKPNTDNGYMYDYNKKNDVPGWKAYDSQIKGIVLTNSIKGITENVFGSLKNLVWVQFGTGVENIGVNAFRGCANLRRVILPDSVKTIEQGAFDNCYRLYEVQLNEGLTKIGDGAFNGCRSLYTVAFPSAIKESAVAKDAFSGAEKIYEIRTEKTDISGKKYGNIAGNSSVSIHSGESTLVNENGYILSGNRLIAYIGEETALTTPAAAKIIAPYALYANTSVKRFIIGDTVNMIEKSAFENCTSLETLTVGAAAANIQQDAFKNCTSVKTLNYKVKNYGTNETTDIFGGMTALKTINFDANVAKLPAGEGMFRGCTALETVTMPAKVAQIPASMFEGCTSLKTVNLAAVTNRINASAFKNCKSLVNIDLTKMATNTTVYTEAFSGCSSLFSIDLTKVSQIQDEAFKNCSGLTGVVTGSRLQILGTSTFEGCVKLIDVVNNTSTAYTPGAANQGGIAKYTTAEIGIGKGASRLKNADGFIFLETSAKKYLVGYQGESVNLVLPANYNGGTYEIYKSAFKSNSQISSIVTGAGVTAIGEEAFRDCIRLYSVDMSASTVTTIEPYTFDGCYNLTNATLPSGLATIGICAFRECEQLGDITATSVTSVAERAFQYSGILSFTAGNGLTAIACDTFSGCARLKTVAIPGVVSISNQAFANCVSMRQINMNAVETIGEYAFYRCHALTSAALPAVRVIGQCGFEECAALTSITLGENLTTISESSFRDCGKLVVIVNNSSFNLKVGEMGPGYITRNAQVVLTAADDTIKTEGDFTYFVDKDTSKTYFLAYIGTADKVSLPAKLGGNSYDIFRFAFFGSQLTEVTLPEGVTSIGPSAFAYSKIQKVLLPTTLKSISDSVFEGSELVEFVANTGLETIGAAAFKHCEKLRTVVFSDTVETVGESLFRECDILSSVNLGKGLTEVSAFMFDGCTNLSTLLIPKSVTSFGVRWYVECPKLIEVIDLTNRLTYDKLTISTKIEPSVKNLKTYEDRSNIATDKNGFVFYSDGNGNNYLINYVGTEKDLVLPTSYNGGTYQIYKYAFYHNTTIETVKLSDKVTGIGEYAFAGCTNLKGLYIPTSVKGTFGVGEGLFYGCNANIVVATGFASAEELPTTWKADWNIQSAASVFSVVYSVTNDAFEAMLKNR